MADSKTEQSDGLPSQFLVGTYFVSKKAFLPQSDISKNVCVVCWPDPDTGDLLPLVSKKD